MLFSSSERMFSEVYDFEIYRGFFSIFREISFSVRVWYHLRKIIFRNRFFT